MVERVFLVTKGCSFGEKRAVIHHWRQLAPLLSHLQAGKGVRGKQKEAVERQ